MEAVLLLALSCVVLVVSALILMALAPVALFIGDCLLILANRIMGFRVGKK